MSGNAETQATALRRYSETRYGAKSWKCERRVVARIEATTKGLDIRYVVTNLPNGAAKWLYDSKRPLKAAVSGRTG